MVLYNLRPEFTAVTEMQHTFSFQTLPERYSVTMIKTHSEVLDKADTLEQGVHQEVPGGIRCR